MTIGPVEQTELTVGGIDQEAKLNRDRVDQWPSPSGV